jgi:hypothetical protein
MSRWWVKAAIQRGISLLPARNYWNEWFQEHVSRSVECTESRFESQLKKSRAHLEFYRKHTPGSRSVPRTVFELGTGWHAVVPVAMFLAGVDEIWTWDIARLIKRHRFQQALNHFLSRIRNNRLSELFPPARPERVAQLAAAAAGGWSDPYTLLRQLNVRAVVGDARRTGLPGGTIDLIASTVVLEYIPREVLGGLLSEFRRIASRQGVMSHEVDLTDEYAYFDSSITPFNFLKFSERAWRLINNPFIPLNRLRVSDFRDCFSEAGFALVEEVATRGDAEALARIRLAPRFARYDPIDLQVIKSWFVARPNALT